MQHLVHKKVKPKIIFSQLLKLLRKEALVYHIRLNLNFNIQETMEAFYLMMVNLLLKLSLESQQKKELDYK